jgi:Phage integrase, N-terminal SAM-like domain
MASLIKPKITSYRTPDGRKCKKDTPGAKPSTSKAKKWYGQYRDADGITRRMPLCTDKTAARQMLNELVRQVERGEAGLVNPLDEQSKKPLDVHVEDYRRYLDSKDNSERHVKETISQIKIVLDGCNFRRIADLDTDKVRQFLKQRRTAGMSAERSNHYIRAIKAFARWLEPKRVARDPFRDLKTQAPGRTAAWCDVPCW